MTSPVILASGLPSWTKSPNALLDYVFNWQDWLAGDKIVNSSWTVPAGLVLDHELHTDYTATVWLSGGTRGRRYVVTNRITTVDERIESRSFEILVNSR